MKKRLLLILFLFIGLSSYGQAVSLAKNQFTIVSDLRLQAGGSERVQVDVSGLLTANDDNGGTYTWMPTSTDADDGFITIKPNAVTTGRWKRKPNANTVKGNSVFSTVSLQTAYVINHGLPFTPTQVYVQATSANAAVPSWISNINATSFTVNFSSVPLLGTLNLSFAWLAIKQ